MIYRREVKVVGGGAFLRLFYSLSICLHTAWLIKRQKIFGKNVIFQPIYLSQKYHAPQNRTNLLKLRLYVSDLVSGKFADILLIFNKSSKAYSVQF